MDPRKRKFTAPTLADRCECDRMPLADGSEAQCMKRKAKGSRYCAQHAKIIYGWTPSEETKRELAAGRRFSSGDA
jgi:hypothetical protein